MTHPFRPATAGLVRRLHTLKNRTRPLTADTGGDSVVCRRGRIRLKSGYFTWVLACFFVAVIYFIFLASDRYVSRAAVVVKQADQIKMLPDTLAMLGLGGSNHQDVLVIQDYLKSADLLNTLDDTLALKAHYQSRKVDYFSRLPAGASREVFLKYYRDHLLLRLDEQSGVLTIELQTFDPAYSQRVVALMLRESERFINQLGHQIALEQLAFVEKEVDRAYQRVQTENARVLAFQNRHQLISPESTSTARLDLVSRIEGELAQQQAQLKQFRRYMKETAPAVLAVTARVEALTEQLKQEQARLTGDDSDAMNDVTARYMVVQKQAALAEDLYKSGLISLEQARIEAYRKLKHLLVISQPARAEEAEYPRRLYNLATTGVLLCLLYGLMAMGLATLREHQD